MTTYSDINGLALIGTGEESGTWGTVTNLNLQAVDRATHGYKEITLAAGTSFDLVTNDMTQASDLNADGNYKALRFTAGAGPSGAFTVFIKSNDATALYSQSKVYIIHNNTSHTMTVSQNTGGTVAISAGKTKIVAAKGPGIVDMLDGLEVADVKITGTSEYTGAITSSNATITGGSVTGITDLTIADGGTGASSASAARTNLGLSIGINVQAYDAGLTDIAGLAVTNGNFIVGDGVNWVAESGDTAIASLGVTATGAELNYNDITALGTSEDNKVVTQASGLVNLSGKVKAASYQETYVSVSSSSNTTTLDCAAANNFSTQLSEATTIAFSNVPTSGTAYSMVLEIKQHASNQYAVTWPASLDWAEGVAPTLSTAANAVDVFSLYTRDGGTTWYGFVSGLGMA